MAYVRERRLQPAGARGAGEVANPFAAFLAARPAEPREKTALDTRVPFTGYAPTELFGSHDGPSANPLFPDRDSFASFVTRRPMDASRELDKLKRDVMKTKKQLLELALDAESSPHEGETGEEEAARLRRLSIARRYLEHPEQIMEPLSHDSAAPSEEGSRLASRQAPSVRSAAVSAPGSSMAPEERARPSSSSSAGRGAGDAATAPAPGTLSRASSGASLLRNAGALTSAPARMHVVKEREPVLDRWSPKVRAFNTMAGKDPTEVRRRCTSMLGGTLAIGSGPMPFYAGEHLLNEGYCCSFRVVGVDSERHPGAGAFALGVSRVPPTDSRLQGPRCPINAYEVPDVVMVGYGAKYIEERKWHSVPWDSSALKMHDRIAMLVTPAGDLVIFVNDKQVVRIATGLGASSKEEQHKFYPIIDLGGHVDSLLLCPPREPPHVQLRSRNRVQRILA